VPAEHLTELQRAHQIGATLCTAQVFADTGRIWRVIVVDLLGSAGRFSTTVSGLPPAESSRIRDSAAGN
jgi:hypothetical protein